jgi:hypothetical protein
VRVGGGTRAGRGLALAQQDPHMSPSHRRPVTPR